MCTFRFSPPPPLSLPLSRVHVNEAEYQVLHDLLLPAYLGAGNELHTCTVVGKVPTLPNDMYVIISKTNPLFDVASGYIHTMYLYLVCT